MKMEKDRGIKKWQSAFMTPELAAYQQQFYKEYEAVAQPVLDEQQMDQMNQVICESMEYVSKVAVTYYEAAAFKQVIGYIHYVDIHKQSIQLKDHFEEIYSLPLSSLIEVNILS